MKRTLIFVDYFDNLAFDAAKRELAKGHEVFLLGCSKSIGICKCNYGASAWICRFCMHLTKSKFSDFKIEENCHCQFVDDIMSLEMVTKAEKMEFSYHDVKELKALKYKGMNIGYAAFSTFVSITRNVSPTFNTFLKYYLDDLLRSEVRLIEVELQYMESIHPDLVVFMCGRHSNQKPLYQIADQKGINYIVTERKWTKDGEDTYDNYVNASPHSPKAIYNKMNECWDNGGEDKRNIAESFFYNRRHGKYAGDTIYTTKQIAGQLPDGFDDSKMNISIFNSSEDEYYSLSKEFDESGVWPNQLMALKSIFEHYKDRDDIRFYLRIHPNLGKVAYKSHTELYSLHFDNVIVLPPESSVCSYTLMDHSSKVIVFNSTMGLESSYWGKPVICLNMSDYSNLNIAYQPKSEKEVFDLIDNPILPSLKSEACLIAAYYLMGGKQEKLRYYPVKRHYYHIGPLMIETYSQFKLFHSEFLLALLLKILRIGTHFGVLGKYHHIGQRTQ